MKLAFRVLYVLFAALLLAPTPLLAQSPPPHVPGEVLIKFKPGAAGSARAAVRANLNARVIRDFSNLGIEHWEVRGLSTEAAIRRMERNPNVQYIEPNYTITLDAVPNDPRFPEMYSLRNTGQTGGTPGADIKATQAWDLFTGSSSVKVGVIDTGVDYNHPDLAANIWTNPGEIPGNNIDDDNNGYVDDIHGYDVINNDGDPFDDNGHGTHCSGTIAAVGNNNVGTTGISWNAQIVGIKFLSGSGSGSTAGAIAAVNYAIAVGVRFTSNSWGGGGFSQALLDAINAAGAQGQLFIAAAGNSSANTDASPHYPSSYNTPYVLAVASTDHNDNLSSFSNFGATTVDIAAPGSSILSTTPGNTYSVFSGTSMATPHVAGVAALTWGRFPALSPLQVKDQIMLSGDVKASLAGRCVTGARLNAFMTIAEPDTVNPGFVTDLSTSDPSSNAIVLNWTATGDDGNTGRASRYEIRYSTAPITPGNFGSATLVVGPDPQPFGSPETFEVGGLDFLTTYYFAIKAFDEFSNEGSMSNVATGTTLGIPEMAASPLTFSANLVTGGTDDQMLTLSNTADGTLDFTIPQPEILFVQPPVIHEYVPVPKGMEDVRQGDPVLTGAGGPDAFGYRWVDSNEPSGPLFNWEDITGTGSLLSLTGDDATSGAVAMGMDFPFYGGTFNSVRICTNGFLSFTDGSTAYDNQPLPSAGGAANMVAPFWDDLNPGAVQRIYTYGDGSRFVVSWVAVPSYTAGGGPYTFQAILYPTGEIRFQYLSMGSLLNNATVGIQNAAKSVGLTTAFNTNYVADNLAVKIIPLRQWLTVSPMAGRIPAGGSMNLNVHFDATGLTGGDYEANINILSNDPGNSPLSLPAELHVTGAPDIAVNPTALDFGENFVGAAPTRNVTISNPGTDNLDVTAVISSDAALTTNFAPFTLPPLGAQNIIVTYNPLSPGTLNATLEVVSNDPGTPSVFVTAVGSAVPAPSFSVNPTSFSETLLTNTAVSRSLRVTNSGGSNYVFTAEAMAITPTGTVPVYSEADVVDLAKGDPDVQFGPEPLRTGGPDVFGYTYSDSDEPTGPVFSWVDISTIGTPIAMTGDDANNGPHPIGFNFPFYGNTFTTFRACTNGWVSFTATQTSFTNTTLPNTATGAPPNVLAAFWDDLHFDTTQRARYHNDGTRLIIQYTGVRRIGESATTNPNTFQVILYPSGTIVYQYLDMRAATKNSATIGIQNATKNDGLQVVFNAAYVKDNLAIRFQPPARFLTVTPAGGTVPPGGFIDLNVGFNAAGLFGGVYDGHVRINGNDPILPQLDVPAELTVVGVPDVAVAPSPINFGPVFIGYPRLTQATISNNGTDVLNVTNITTSDPAYGVDVTSFAIPAGGTALINVSFSPTATASYPAVLTVVSNDPDSPNYAVNLSGSGLVAPDIDPDPTSLSATLTIPDSETQSLTLYNTGGSDLNFVVGATVTASSVPVYDEVDLGKDGVDIRAGILGSGGPDMFGYTWRDSDEPGGPIFDWVDITGIGFQIPVTGDDQNIAGTPIGFDFPFYGNTFNSINVCSNGWLSFTSTATSLTNNPLPSSGSGVPENLLALFWDDLDPRPGNRVYGYRDGTRCIISYVGVPRFSSGGPYTCQVILYPSGRIVFQYLSMQGARLNEATIGIQNAAKDDGLTVVHNAAYMHDNLAIEFRTVPDWLSVSPSTGTIPAGGSADLNVLFDSNGLYGRLYEGSIRITGNDPDEGLTVIPTSLLAIGVPDVSAAPASLDFGPVYVSQSADLGVALHNVGSGDLEITALSMSDPNFSIVGGPSLPLTLGERGSVNLTLRFAPSGACSPCAGQLLVDSNDPDSPQFAVDLSGTGLIPPEIDVTPTSLQAALATTLGPSAMTRTKELVIANTGGSDLDWTATPLVAMASGGSPVTIGGDAEGAKDDPGVPGEPTVAGSGGPDAGGYRWVDSNDPGGVPFDWVDITGVGTPVPFSGDDQNQGPVALPFPFTFYGNTFNSIRLCTNGWVSFTSTLTAFTNTTLPNAGSAVAENLLAPFWDDLTFSAAGDVYTYYDGTKFIISYVAVPRLSSGGPYTFQILLFPNGTIDFQYLSMQGTRLNEATIGIQNGTKDAGLQVVFNAAYVEDNLRIRFAKSPEWLTVSPESGTVPAGETRIVEVTFDAEGLADGDYSGMVDISSNDLNEPLVSIPCDLHVGVASAAFDLDPGSLNRSSNGSWVTGYVFPPSGNAPPQIRTSSVMLERTVPVAPNSPVSYSATNATYKFDRGALSALLSEGNSVPVEVIGEVEDVTWFSAVDYIRVLKPKMTGYTSSTAGPTVYMAGTDVVLEWQDPEGYVADYFDLWFSADGGNTWTLVQAGIVDRTFDWTVPYDMTETGLLELVAVDELGVMGSWMSEAFTIVPALSGVDDVPVGRFDVRIAGANPVRGSASLDLALPEARDVSIQVFDVRGSLVRQVADRRFDSGRHIVDWDGSNSGGARVSAGVYLVRIVAGPETRLVRLSLIP